MILSTKMIMKTKMLFLVWIWLLHSAYCSRILVIDPIGTKSHHNSFVPLLNELASDHEITILTFMKSGLKQDRVQEIIINGSYEASLEMLPNFFEVKDDYLADFKEMIEYFKVQYRIAELFFEDKSVQEAIGQEYDLVMFSILMSDLLAPIATAKGIPFIVISPNVLFEPFGRIFGVRSQSASVPNMLLNLTPPLTFFQRTGNMIVNELYSFLTQMTHCIYDPLLRRYYPGMKPLEEHLYDANAVFINTHPTTAYTIPYPPTVIEIGGIHCRPAVPLPKGIEEFLEDGEDGFILLSLGSTIPIGSVPAEKKAAIFSVLSRVSQKVIIKWEGDIPEDVPKNIKLLKWVPQQDLLGHPKIRLFITHGGLYSLQEAIFHSTPVLGIPVGNDQGQNLARAEKEGYAKVMVWDDLNENTFGRAIDEVLSNQSYKENARRLSILFRDQPETPLQRAVYWIEYIIRHKGAPHMRFPGLESNWFQRYLFDVLLFLGGILCFVVISIYFVLKLTFKVLLSKKINENRKKQ